MRIPKVVVGGHEVDVPPEVLQEAIRFANRICPPCSRCAWSCDCWGYIRDMFGVICRYIRNWERRAFLVTHRVVSKNLTKPRSLTEDLEFWSVFNEAIGTQHHPECEGFEQDHMGSDDASRWRRFHIERTLRELLK